jgi:hypothetical protein
VVSASLALGGKGDQLGCCAMEAHLRGTYRMWAG